jgi:hypothetical protein
MTPEGRVKDKIKRVLKDHGCWYYMPVPAGFGVPSLDFLCSTPCGRAFGIEAKAPGKKPTPRQQATMREMEAKSVKCFLIDGDTTELEEWLSRQVKVL